MRATRPNGPTEHSPGLRPQADALGLRHLEINSRSVSDADGVLHTSPGQRPGLPDQKALPALKARFIAK
ncbi:MAG TPA: hypothetical protein VFE51_22050 [Verrucomicrobiae bacterium]|nr:hypothetical protein [Verrucomicrobiae bacterium]